MIILRTAKTGETATVFIVPALARSIDAGPCGDLTFIVGENRRPMTKESFGNWFGGVCRATGVPGRAHGLRKALASRLAERGATVAQLDALFAWRGGGMASLYTRQASRMNLARSAIALLEGENEGGSSLPRTLQEFPRTEEKSK